MKVLFIESSPRGEQSHSSQAANAYLKALGGDATVYHLNLWETELPEMSGPTITAKYKQIRQQEKTADEQQAWDKVTRLAQGFKDADIILITVPMWNFQIPYRLKHYIDVISQPGLTFNVDEDGNYQGNTDAKAVLVYSRGGDYSDQNGETDPFNFQQPYMHAWLNFLGIDDIEDVAVQNTLSGDSVASEQIQQAADKLEKLARSVNS